MITWDEIRRRRDDYIGGDLEYQGEAGLCRARIQRIELNGDMVTFVCGWVAICEYNTDAENTWRFCESETSFQANIYFAITLDRAGHASFVLPVYGRMVLLPRDFEGVMDPTKVHGLEVSV